MKVCVCVCVYGSEACVSGGRTDFERTDRERVDDFAVENCLEDLAMPRLAHWSSGSAISKNCLLGFFFRAELLVGWEIKRMGCRQELKDLARRMHMPRINWEARPPPFGQAQSPSGKG